MIKDKLLKVICIPLIGIIIPLASGLINFTSYTLIENCLSAVLFILMSNLVWKGCVNIILKLRTKSFLKQDVFLKLFAQLSIGSVYGFLLVGLFSFIWQRIFIHDFYLAPVIKSSLLASLAVIFFSLIYEILFLSKERELDTVVVNHLDKELLYSEVTILKNELDPHFVYNSLMPLYYLIKNDVPRAETFTFKLMQVYQYFLENRNKDFIRLGEELNFLESFNFLLNVRYRDSVKLSIDIPDNKKELMILPSSLQILIENAIKHNDFDHDLPLGIHIYIENSHLVIANKIIEKQEIQGSTKIGLRNLRDQYRLLTRQRIQVIKTSNWFIVKLPLLDNSMQNAGNNYRREVSVRS